MRARAAERAARSFYANRLIHHVLTKVESIRRYKGKRPTRVESLTFSRFVLNGESALPRSPRRSRGLKCGSMRCKFIAMRLEPIPCPIFHGRAPRCYFHRLLMGALRFLRNTSSRKKQSPYTRCDEISFSVVIFPGIIHKRYFAFRKYVYLFFFSRKNRASNKTVQ